MRAFISRAKSPRVLALKQGNRLGRFIESAPTLCALLTRLRKEILKIGRFRI
ncbi:hypothetical protein [uncultured Helicobacter sp.]|uniref:hypothetical protein n=1 Tax=uncultured Helicobacter sp. TaxID=175537 RepID=UPI00375342AE